MEKLISVIIPVYNVDKYLFRCIKSIIDNSYKNLEIICVDDGSTDSSLSILREAASFDKRIIVVSQSNEGVSSARNHGLKIARGDYIAFIDADDWVLPTYFQELIEQTFAHPDSVICCNPQNVNDENDVIDNSSTNRIKLLKTKDVFKYSAVKCYVWGRLYPRLVISGLRFIVGIKLGEDTLYNLESLFKTAPNKVVLIEKKLYIHYCRNDSAVHVLNVNNHYDAIKKGYFILMQKYERRFSGILLEQAIRRLLSVRHQLRNSDTKNGECNELLSQCEEKKQVLSFGKRVFYSLLIKNPKLYSVIRR